MDPTIPFPNKAKSHVEQIREQRDRMIGRPPRNPPPSTAHMTPEQARAQLSSMGAQADAKFQEMKRISEELAVLSEDMDETLREMLRAGKIEVNKAYVTLSGVLMYYIDMTTGQAKVMTLPNGSA